MSRAKLHFNIRFLNDYPTRLDIFYLFVSERNVTRVQRGILPGLKLVSRSSNNTISKRHGTFTLNCQCMCCVGTQFRNQAKSHRRELVFLFQSKSQNKCVQTEARTLKHVFTSNARGSVYVKVMN